MYAPTQDDLPCDDLPCDDDIPIETLRHKLQMDILVDAYMNWLIANQKQGFVGGNMFVYFSPDQVRATLGNVRCELLPTDKELAEQERQRAEEERQRADRLAAKLRELGIDPNQP
ncbi:MAG: hypothetical protein IGS54_11395 [Elainella sp. C42_A2020_010]|nr:hypothetical protein [Elainella sp. C42_A2020_010]